MINTTNANTIDLSGVKNIIFDLGNVICDIDFNLTVEAFNKLGSDKVDLTLDNYMEHPVFGALEKGEISTEQFRDEVRSLLELDLSDQQIDEAWAAVVINSDQARIDMLSELGEKYKLFLLSNTDGIHIEKAVRVINETTKGDFLSLFEEVYLSHLLKLAKPSAEIYEFVLNDADMKASETLFIDDNLPNIEAARQLGIQSYHFDSKKEKLIDLFA